MDKKKAVNIHNFSDAYAAVVFARIKTLSVAQVHLLTSKARIVSMKQITIPRRELIAATVEEILCISVIESLGRMEECRPTLLG